MMIRANILILMALSGLPIGLGGCGPTTETVEATDYHPPPDPGDGLADDRLVPPGPPFDPGLISPMPIGDERVNLSAAVIRLDIPLVRPDSEPELGILHPSYTSAVAASGPGRTALPSIDMIDGKAKQFDDGLRAALDLAHYRGLGKSLVSHVDSIGRILARVGPESPAAPWLAAGLELAGKRPAITATAERDRWLREFRANEMRSKPVGCATWSRDLADAFRFARFFAHPFGRGEEAIARALAGALAGDEALLADYRRALAFRARLTNPSRQASVVALIGRGDGRTDGPAVALFPEPTSREAELFDRLFPAGAPAGVDLIRELIARIRSGRVGLDPRPDGGWYDQQVFALEPLLLPEKAEEHAKLLLTKSYKRRRTEAFKALLTKRRETHYLDVKTSAIMTSTGKLTPGLRVEPCPSYFLRTARAYGFLADFLDETIGEPDRKSLHGLRAGGAERPLDLRAELTAMRSLFFGLALVTAEVIGLEPACLDAEGLDAPKCLAAALEWLAHPEADPDLAADTRVSSPILVDPGRRATRIWATLGVRLAKLDASFARGPRLRPAGGGDWSEVPSYLLAPAEYRIAVDEFAEVELKGLRVLDRDELRRACDEGKTRERIVAILGK